MEERICIGRNLVCRSGNSEDEVGREVVARDRSVFVVVILSEELLSLHHSSQLALSAPSSSVQ